MLMDKGNILCYKFIKKQRLFQVNSINIFKIDWSIEVYRNG